MGDSEEVVQPLNVAKCNSNGLEIASAKRHVFLMQLDDLFPLPFCPLTVYSSKALFTKGHSLCCFMSKVNVSVYFLIVVS